MSLPLTGERTLPGSARELAGLQGRHFDGVELPSVFQGPRSRSPGGPRRP